MVIIVEDDTFYCFSSYSLGSIPFHKGVSDDLVDEKGAHEDIHKFASIADIVVCCLCLNSETVRLRLWLLFSCLCINDHCRNYVLGIIRYRLSISLISFWFPSLLIDHPYASLLHK